MNSAKFRVPHQHTGFEVVTGCKETNLPSTSEQRTSFMKTKTSRFGLLVARCYPAVDSFASRLTDDPREAIAFTRGAFNGARKQAENLRNPTAIALVLISAVIRGGLASR